MVGPAIRLVSCCCVVGAPVVLVCCPAIDWDVLYIKERLAEPGGLPPAQGQAIPMFFWLARQMLCFYYDNYHGCYLFLLCFPPGSKLQVPPIFNVPSSVSFGS
jgi:hypothetical protein